MPLKFLKLTRVQTWEISVVHLRRASGRPLLQGRTAGGVYRRDDRSGRAGDARVEPTLRERRTMDSGRSRKPATVAPGLPTCAGAMGRMVHRSGADL